MKTLNFDYQKQVIETNEGYIDISSFYDEDTSEWGYVARKFQCQADIDEFDDEYDSKETQIFKSLIISGPDVDDNCFELDAEKFGQYFSGVVDARTVAKGAAVA